jgi:hypothetical protein
MLLVLMNSVRQKLAETLIRQQMDKHFSKQAPRPKVLKIHGTAAASLSTKGTSFLFFGG